MRYVNFVDVTVKKLPMADHIEYIPSVETDDKIFTEDGYIFCEAPINKAPVHRISRVKRESSENPFQSPKVEDTYIAYTKEVQDLLEMPFDTMRDEIELKESLYNQALDRLASYAFTEKTFWRRLKFLFTGKVGV